MPAARTAPPRDLDPGGPLAPLVTARRRGRVRRVAFLTAACLSLSAPAESQTRAPAPRDEQRPMLRVLVLGFGSADDGTPPRSLHIHAADSVRAALGRRLGPRIWLVPKNDIMATLEGGVGELARHDVIALARLLRAEAIVWMTATSDGGRVRLSGSVHQEPFEAGAATAIHAERRDLRAGARALAELIAPVIRRHELRP
jgi:hypothetical protein